MKIFLVLFLFCTLQAFEIPCREYYQFQVIPELIQEPKTLTEAVRWGTLEQVEEFLWQRWNPNGIDESERTSMHYAVFRQDDQAIPILHSLLTAQGNLTVQDRDGATPVREALTLGNKEALKFFIVNCRLLIDPVLRKEYPVLNEVFIELGFFQRPQGTEQERVASGSFSKIIARPSSSQLWS